MSVWDQGPPLPEAVSECAYQDMTLVKPCGSKIIWSGHFLDAPGLFYRLC